MIEPTLGVRLRAVIRRARRREPYGLVFVLLLAAFAVGARSEKWATLVLVTAIGATLVALAFAGEVLSGRRLGYLLVLMALAYVVALSEAILFDPGQRSLASAMAAVGLLITPPIAVARLLRERTVTMQTLYAAGAVYLMIGLGFGALYRSLTVMSDGPVFTGGAASVEQLNYFSFVTLTTLGFGDITPATPEARALVVIETLIGQLFLATLVARLVSGLRARPMPEGGVVSSEQRP